MLEGIQRYKAEVFQALGHPTRLAIVHCLNQGELSVGQICQKVGVEQANASQHLAILRSKHLVRTRKAGNQTYYRLRHPAFGKVLESLDELFLTDLNDALETARNQQVEARQP